MAFAVTSWKNNTRSTSVAVATSLALHDVAIAWAITDGTLGSFTWPSGFTEIKKQVCTADSQTLGVAIKKDCTGSEGTLTITCNEACVAGILGVSGADNTTQPDVTTPTPGNNDTAQASAWTITCAITPSTNGCLLVAVMGSDITATSASAVVHSFSDTGGLSWTKHDDLNDGGFEKGGIGSATQATAAATTVTGTGTLAGKSAGRSLIVVAVRPAAGGGGGTTVTPPVSSMTLSGNIPTILTPRTVLPPAGTLSFTATVPTISLPNNILAPVGSLSLTGAVPTVIATANQLIDVPLSTLMLTGNAPAIASGVTVQVPLGTLTLTGNTPTVSATQNNYIDVPAGSLSLSARAPVVIGTDEDIGGDVPRRRTKRNVIRGGKYIQETIPNGPFSQAPKSSEIHLKAPSPAPQQTVQTMQDEDIVAATVSLMFELM